MRTLATAVLATFIVFLINGCTAQKMTEPMDSEMSSLDKPMEKSMKGETMMEDTAAEMIQPKIVSMDDSMKDKTMMENETAEMMKPTAEAMDKATQ